MDAATPDPGRHAITKADADRGAFKTPTLRDAARRPPYMHDGSLAAVVEFYDRGGTANAWRSPHVTPLGLSAAQRADLVAFLEALTGEIDAATLRRPSLPPDP